MCTGRAPAGAVGNQQPRRSSPRLSSTQPSLPRANLKSQPDRTRCAQRPQHGRSSESCGALARPPKAPTASASSHASHMRVAGNRSAIPNRVAHARQRHGHGAPGHSLAIGHSSSQIGLRHPSRMMMMMMIIRICPGAITHARSPGPRCTSYIAANWRPSLSTLMSAGQSPPLPR